MPLNRLALSALGTLALGPFEADAAIPAGLSAFSPFGPAAASLVFANNRLADRTELPAELAARGVIVTTLAEAAVKHADLLKAHFMARPQKLG